MSKVKDYRSAFVEKGAEREVIKAFHCFGYKLESAQYSEVDSEPWESKIYAFDKTEVYDALGAFPAPAHKKPYPYPGYVSLLFSLDPNNPDYAYYTNVYRLYRRVQFDIFTLTERNKKQKRKMLLPAFFWIVYLLAAIVGVVLIMVAHYNGALFSFEDIPALFSYEGGDYYLLRFIGVLCVLIGGGLLILHNIWRLIFHGIRKHIAKRDAETLINMRKIILKEARRKLYPGLNYQILRQIENDRGIYSGTPYGNDARRRDDVKLVALAVKYNKVRREQLLEEEKGL